MKTQRIHFENMNGNPCRSRAFTLVELLVVIGIIAVLLSVLLPALAKARQQAQLVQCMSNMRQWGVALNIYVNQSKGCLPVDGADSPTWNDPNIWFNVLPPILKFPSYNDLQQASRWTVNANGGAVAWVPMTGPYTTLPSLGDASIYVCPTASGIRGIATEGFGDSHFLVNGMVTSSPGAPVPAPGMPVRRATLISYVMNSKLLSSGPLKISRLKPSSQVVFMTEMRHSVGEVPPGMDDYYHSYGGASNRLTTRDLGRLKADWQRFTGRHRRGGNLLFADGHVAWFAMKDVLTPSANTSSSFTPPPPLPVQYGNWNRPDSFIWDPVYPAGS